MEPEKVKNEDGIQPNSSSGSIANTESPAQPASPKANVTNSSPSVDAQVKDLTEKIDRITNQYDGSTKEALRLKEENEKLKAQIEAAKNSASSTTDERSFQKLVEEKGFVAALDHAFGNKLSSLEQRVEGLLVKESKKIYDDFVTSHKGLLDATIIGKFEAELSKIKNVYPDYLEAMEKAYVLAGGRDAETKPPVSSPVVKTEDSKQVEQNLINSAMGGSDDKLPAPVVQIADPAKQISDLRSKAAQLELQGKLRQAAELYAQIEDIKGKLAAKV